jgi:PAS domain S-box-containing protein
VGGYRLSDLLDLAMLQKMADAHYRAAGVPIGIIDAIDGSILVGSGWQDICVKFHRENPISLQRCQESDDYIKDRLAEGEACHYKCRNGLWDIGVPIVVAGRHLATMFLGQFFYEAEAPDREFFVQQAHEIGFDVDEYLAALDRVPVFSREKVEYILEYDKALVGFVADLAAHATVKIEADEKLRESERKFRAIFDQTYQFLGLLSTDGTLLEANRTAIRFAGVKDADVKGKPFWETAWWAHSEQVKEDIRLAVQKAASGEFVRFESTACAADGSLRHIDFSLKPLADEAGRVILLIPEGRDITERIKSTQEKEQLRNQLAMAQKMESVGRLAGGVAHDFNNMLGVIVGNAELALAQVDQDLPVRQNLEEIRTAAQHSADLTRQLLAFARRQTVAPRVLDLNEVVERMLTILQRVVGEEVELSWMPGRDVAHVRIDPGQIEQILMNLMANSRDAISGVGKVSIATENLAVAEEYCAAHIGFAPGGYVKLAVSDNGCGMEQEMLACIFEPFFTTNQGSQGIGLGLATVYGIVSQNGGAINVYSEPGKGTSFEICLPRYDGESARVADGASAGVMTGGAETVLLVEDEAMLLRLAQTMLERLGYEVLSAGTPGAAIRLAAEYDGDIHLLMTDVVMPEMNGRELCRQIRLLRPDLRCLFTSGYTADVIADRGVLEKGVHFIHKPYAMQDLAGKLREVLEQAPSPATPKGA